MNWIVVYTNSNITTSRIDFREHGKTYVCRNHNPVLSSFMTMTYHRQCNKSNTMATNRGTVTAYPSATHEFEDTKRVTRSRKLMTDRQYNGKKKKYKITNNNLQNTRRKAKD